MDNRGLIEGLVVSCLLQDPTLISEYPVTSESFKVDKTKFFFELAEGMSKGYKVIDEVSVSTFLGLSPTLTRSYNENGGFESVDKAIKLADISNYDKYVDDLFKINLVDQLGEMGFNVKKKINIQGNEVKPVDLFVNMSSEQVYNFYEMLLADASINANSSDLKIDQLFYTEEDIEKKKNGELDFTIPFDTTLTWIDESNNERSFKPLKLLNDALDGMPTQNGLILNSGSSGSGKSTLTFNQVMGLVESDSKVMYCSNEQNVEYFREILICYVATIVFKTPSINRRKIRHLDLNEHEYEIFMKCNKFIKEKYEDKLFFVSVNDFDVNRIIKMAKKLNLSDGVDTLVLETFKAESAIDDSVNNMVENSRLLDKFGRQNNIRVILPVQTRTADEGVISYLTATSLSGSKQIKEVSNTLLLMRKVTKEELDESNKKMFLAPYRWDFNNDTKKYEKRFLKIKKEGEETISRRRRPSDKSEDGSNGYDINPDDSWRLIFIDKCRNASDNKILLAKLDGEHGIFSFVGFANHVYEGRLRGY